MDTSTVVSLTQDTLRLTLLIGAPLVLGAAIVGLLVSFLQAITQIQDQTMATAFKVLVVFVLLALLGTWMGSLLIQFGDKIFLDITKIK